MIDNERIITRMTVGEVLDYSIEIYKRNFKELLKIILVLYIPLILLTGIITGRVMGTTLDTLLRMGEGFANWGTSAQRNTPEPYWVDFIYYIILILLTSIYNITLKLVLNSSIIRLIYADIAGKEKKPVKAFIKESFKKLPSLMGNACLFWLIISGVYTGLSIVSSIIQIIPSIAMSSVSYQDSVFWIIVLGILSLVFYLAVMFGLGFFFVKLLFGVQAVTIENKYAAASISRSMELTKGSVWSIMAAVVFGFILANILSIMIYAVSGIALPYSRNLFILLFTVAQVAAAILYPFQMILYTVLFVNQKVKKEGFDLELRVDKMLETSKMENLKCSKV